MERADVLALSFFVAGPRFRSTSKPFNRKDREGKAAEDAKRILDTG
jgi:hypothetical protein